MINKKIIKIIYLSLIGLIIIVPYLSKRFSFKHNKVTTARVSKVETMPNGSFKIKFRYEANSQNFYFYTVSNKVIYSLKIVYNKDNPAEYVFLTLSSIYFNKRMILLWFLFITESALLNTIANSQNKEKEIL